MKPKKKQSKKELRVIRSTDAAYGDVLSDVLDTAVSAVFDLTSEDEPTDCAEASDDCGGE